MDVQIEHEEVLAKNAVNTRRDRLLPAFPGTRIHLPVIVGDMLHRIGGLSAKVIEDVLRLPKRGEQRLGRTQKVVSPIPVYRFT